MPDFETSASARSLHRLRELAREVAREVAAPAAEGVDRHARWPADTVRGLATAGLLGLTVPREHGGLGEGAEALAVATEELGTVCGSSALVFGMHSVATATIAAKVRPPQVRRYLEPILRGEHVTTLALSEPGTGVHFYLPRTTFERREDGSYRLSGTKSFVTSAGHADSYVISAAAAGGEGDPGTFSCFVVDAHAEGIELGPPWDGLGMRGNSSRTVSFHGTRLDPDHQLGREGDETWYLFDVVAPYFLVAMSATYLGVARGALEVAQGHVASRTYEHTGRSLAREGPVPVHLAEMWVRVERGRQLLRHAARRLDGGHPEAARSLFAAKIEVVRTAVDVTDRAMVLTGGRGYTGGSRLGRALRDARAGHLMSPSTDLLLRWLGRSLLDLPLL